MLKLTRFACIAALTCAMVVSAKADQSTPKGAALDFGNALLAGDTKAMRATSIGSDEDFKVFDALGSMISGMKKLSDAAAEKFGKDNPLSASTKDMDIAAELNKPGVKVKEEGDTAVIVNEEKKEKDPMKLVKKDGKWFVDLKSFPKDGMDEVVKMAPVMAKVASETAADIKAGKFKDAAEAQQAFGTKMVAAMMESAPQPK